MAVHRRRRTIGRGWTALLFGTMAMILAVGIVGLLTDGTGSAVAARRTAPPSIAAPGTTSSGVAGTPAERNRAAPPSTGAPTTGAPRTPARPRPTSTSNAASASGQSNAASADGSVVSGSFCGNLATFAPVLTQISAGEPASALTPFSQDLAVLARQSPPTVAPDVATLLQVATEAPDNSDPAAARRASMALDQYLGTCLGGS